MMMMKFRKKLRSPKNNHFEKHRPVYWLVGVFLIFFMLGAAGCGPVRSYESEETQAPFIPPTLAPTITPTVPTPALAPEVQETASPGSCSDILVFQEDLTIPDGMEVSPGATIDKRWEVENRGTCDWTEGYTIRLIEGPALGSPETQALYPARSNSFVTIRIVFAAPEEPGIHRSAWQAYSPSDQPFGDPIYIEIFVTDETEEPPPTDN